MKESSPVPTSKHELQSGDIIFFRSPEKKKFAVSGAIQKVIEHVHGQIKAEGGDNLLHVAICTGHDESGEPLITHVTEAEGVSGCVEEPLQAGFKRDGIIDRSYMFYRPRDKNLQDAIVEEAKAAARENGFSWKVESAVRGAKETQGPLTKQTGYVEYDRDTHCSKFVAETVTRAVSKEYEQRDAKVGQFALDVNLNSTPKTLESSLHRLSGYTAHHHNAGAAYAEMKKVVEIELERLENKAKTIGDVTKFSECKNTYLAFEAMNHDKDDRKKAEALFSAMLPVFSKHPDRSFKNLFGMKTASAETLLKLKPSESAYDAVKKEVENQLIRLGKKDSFSGIVKYRKCQAAYDNYLKDNKTSLLGDREKALSLAKHMSEQFGEARGYSWKRMLGKNTITTSAKKLMKIAAKFFIYPRDMKSPSHPRAQSVALSIPPQAIRPRAHTI